MTTNNSANLYCIRFNFGVPLEDVCPPDDIHPKLHNLLYQTQLAVKSTSLPLDNLLSDSSVSFKEVLVLKESLIEGIFQFCSGMNPAAFLYLIRHFLGLLPLPLFVKIISGKILNWDYLAMHCRKCHLRQNIDLNSEISRIIHSLPQAHIMMTYYLINFFRKYLCKKDKFGRVNPRHVCLISKYFTSSLFSRPYIPKLTNKRDKMNFLFLFYIIVNWSHINVDNYFEISPIRNFVSNKKYWNRASQTYGWMFEENKDFCEGNTTTSSEESGDGVDKKEIERDLEVQPVVKVSSSKESLTSQQNDFFAARSIKEFSTSTPARHKLTSSPPKIATNNNSEKVEQVNSRNQYSNSNSNIYEVVTQISEDKSNLNSDSKTAIYTTGDKNIKTSRILNKTATEANRSIKMAMSKISDKLKLPEKIEKSKHTLKYRFPKYNLLTDENVKKTKSLPVTYSVKNQSNVKYTKLSTI